MIVKELYRTRQDGINLYKTYSDSNFYIKQIETGHIYEIAIDIEGSSFTYEETDEKIEIVEPMNMENPMFPNINVDNQ